MSVHHGVIDDSIHVGVTVLSTFLKLFWLHWHLGVDVAIVDAYRWAFVFLLFPTERRGTRQSQEEQDISCVPFA